MALVAAGGALGGVARVALAHAFPVAVDRYPWTTLLENLAGAFALGLVLTVLAERVDASAGVRLFVGTGALGAFTTYSTFADEVAQRLLAGHVAVATAYVVATLGGGLAAAWAGVRLARWRPGHGTGRTRAAGSGGIR